MKLTYAAMIASPMITRVREIGINGDIYMRRYYTKWDSLRFYEIIRSDADRDLHDHPWDFTSTILSGSYREFRIPSPDQAWLNRPYEAVFEEGAVVVRKAIDLHRLEVISGPVWTAVIVGRTLRKWGYMTANGWVPWDEYMVQK